MDVNTQWLSVEHHRIHVIVAGSGPHTLVCWPGTGEPAEEFLDLMERGASAGYRVAAIDPPGHGLSDAWADGWDWSKAGLILKETLAQLGNPAAMLVGHSLGGTTILMAHAQVPTARGLLVLDGGLPMDQPYRSQDAVAAALRQWYQENEFPDWDTALFHVRAELKRWTPTIETGVRAMLREDSTKVSPRGDIPTVSAMLWLLAAYRPSAVPASDLPALLLIGEAKPSPEDEDSLKAKLPNLDIQELPDAGHELPWDAPEDVYQAAERLASQMNWS